MYQIKTDTLLGFVVKSIGKPISDKIAWMSFSCVGNIFCTIEKEAATRQSLNFYIISKISNEGQTTSNNPKDRKGQPTGQKQIASVEDTYEFRKTARYEVTDKNFVGEWDQNGRYFVLYGKKNSQFDKQPKQIRFYNMFGELL